MPVRCCAVCTLAHGTPCGQLVSCSCCATPVSALRVGIAVRRGIDFLLRTQKDGTWAEPEFTGTGFPGYGFGDEMDFDDPAAVASLKQGRELGRGFMINDHMYRHYFPMMAMGRARKYLARHG